MATWMLQYSPQWSGSRIGSGATVFNFMAGSGPSYEPDLVAAAVRDWFEARKVALPNDVTITYPREAKIIDAENGTLSVVPPVSPLASTVGTYANEFSAASGRIVRWTTGAVVHGHRVIGHTYLVPSGGVYENDGNIYASTITADNPAHEALIDDCESAGNPLAIWTRPKPGRSGALSQVVSGVTLARPVSLRTRND